MKFVSENHSALVLVHVGMIGFSSNRVLHLYERLFEEFPIKALLCCMQISKIPFSYICYKWPVLSDCSPIQDSPRSTWNNSYLTSLAQFTLEATQFSVLLRRYLLEFLQFSVFCNLHQ